MIQASYLLRRPTYLRRYEAFDLRSTYGTLTRRARKRHQRNHASRSLLPHKNQTKTPAAMFSRPSLLIAAIVLAAVSVPSAQAYVPQSSSAFGGSALLSAPSANSASAAPRKGDMSMKKGKPNVPVNMRSNYRKQQQMAGMRDQMIAASTAGEDGLPVFNLFVRTKKANVSLIAIIDFNIN